MFFEQLDPVETRNIERAHEIENQYSRKVNRSLIHPQYARRFIRMYLNEGG